MKSFDLKVTTRPLSAVRYDITPALLLGFSVIILLWAPFGFRMLGVIEEWGLIQLFMENGTFFVTGPSSPLSILLLRPFSIATFALSYTLTPQSFLAWNVINNGAIIAKAAVMAYIVWWTLRDRRLALLAGLLFMLYPADTMQMTTRSIHINFAIALSVSAIAFILSALDERRSHMRLVLSLLAAVLFLCGSLTYETGLFLAPTPLLLLWVRQGHRGMIRTLPQQILPASVWVTGILAHIAYILLVSSRADLYQQSLAGPGTSIAALVQERLPYLFTIGLYREFLHAWYDSARIVAQTPALWIWLGALIAAMALLFVAAGRSAPSKARPPAQLLARLAIAGLLLAALGYLPYLSSMSHILITQRTHLYSALGGTLAVTALIGLTFGRVAALSAAAWCLAIGLGFAAQWNQVDHYMRLSDRMRMILSGILESAPDLPADGRVLIIDHSGQLHSTWMLRGDLLGNALTYLHGKTVRPVVCLEPGLLWASFVTDTQARPGRCVEHDDTWEIGVGVPGTFKLPKEALVQLEIAADGTTRRYTNERIPEPAPSAAQRWAGILGCWPAASCRYEPPRDFWWRFDFGKWWSLEEAPWGAGWRDVEWSPPAWRPLSYAWMIGGGSRVWAPLNPRPGPHLFRMRVHNWISAEAKERLRVSVNGRQVLVQWSDANLVVGRFDGALLKKGLNDITLESEQHPLHGISLAIDWIEIGPL